MCSLWEIRKRSPVILVIGGQIVIGWFLIRAYRMVSSILSNFCLRKLFFGKLMAFHACQYTLYIVNNH